jgi:HAMP domain-containing protein
MNVPARPRLRIELRHRLTLFGVILVVAVTLLNSSFTYSLARRWLESSQQRELLAIVNTAATEIDGSLLSLVHRRPDGTLQGEDEFLEIQAFLDAVVAANRLSSHGSPLYIMRPASDFARSHALEFVVMAQGTTGGHFVGNSVRAADHLRRALAGVPTASGLYEDSEGTWISAAAPILDSQGAVVGLLQADRPVDWFNARAREQLRPLVAIALLGLALSGLLAYGFARGLSRPVQTLVGATHAIADGRLEHRVPIERNDELGDLAASVNQMAVRLRAAQAELELQRQELADALAAAHGASRAKSEFLANMSHELRTPLNAVIGYAEMLREDAATQGRAGDEADLTQILEAARHLLKLIATVLDFAKADADKLELNPGWHTVDALLE